MDPNANLKEQLELAYRIQRDEDQDTISDAVLDSGPAYAQEIERRQARIASSGVRLAELVLAMHEWISKGGFLPKDWQPPVDAVGREVEIDGMKVRIVPITAPSRKMCDLEDVTFAVPAREEGPEKGR